MRVIISARKGHNSPDKFTHYLAVDEGRGFHGLLADLSGLQHSIVNPDSFVDPSIKSFPAAAVFGRPASVRLRLALSGVHPARGIPC